MNLGEKILNMRKARGWSQEELAERIGVTRQAVSRWESGAAKPDADNIIVLCDLFGVTADYLLRDLHWGIPEDREPPVEWKENALKKAIREMPLRKWIGWILTVLCGLGVLVLRVLSNVRPCIYDGIGGLQGFLKTYGLEPLWTVLLVGLAAGLWKLLSPKSLKEYPWKTWWDRFASAIHDLLVR